MSLEGTIRDLGLHEIGQLLSLSRKSGTLSVSSLLRGVRAWIRFADGAMVDAGAGEPVPAGDATAPAKDGARPVVEEAILDVLAWREGQFAFLPDAPGTSVASRVRIPADAMLVESVRREDAWSTLRDRVPSADVVPSFVDVEPQALPLLRLVPQEWEVLTRVDGQRDLRTLATLLQRDLLDVAAIVHGLVGTGLLVVREGGVVRRPTVTGSMDIIAADLPPARVAGRTPDALEAPETPEAANDRDVPGDLPGGVAAPDAGKADELWIPEKAELAVYAVDGDIDDLVFDPQRAGLMTPHGTPRIHATATPAPSARPAASSGTAELAAPTVTLPAPGGVASEAPEPSSKENDDLEPFPHANAALALRDAGDTAARGGDFETALSCWSRALQSPVPPADADRIREAIGLAARMQALLHPTAQH